MKWSQYNYLFESKKHGWLLYNSASNTFAQIDDALYPEIIHIQKNPNEYDFGSDPGLYFQLRNAGILVEDRGDQIFQNLLKMQRLQNNYDNGVLLLTIAPTRACNFDCGYCYEQERKPIYMSEDTENELFAFIKRYKRLTRLFLTWYGGEPLLCFSRICSLTEKITSLEVPFGAMMVTNGYLLNAPVISKLSDLKIHTLQITIDGREPVHNQRRPLKDGGATFQTIMKNIEALFQQWEGSLLLRVNIDHKNKSEYHLIHQELREKFSDAYQKGHLTIYPGIVHDFNKSHPDVSCLIDRDEEALFTMQEYYTHGLDDLRTFPGRSYTGCTACRKNGFVVGPEGELYKCWDDLGIEARQVGSIKKKRTWNAALIADYMVGASYLDDPECQKCFYLPVCDGGCPNVRLRNYVENQQQNVCSKFKNHLEDLLEIFYEQKEKHAQHSTSSDSDV